MKKRILKAISIGCALALTLSACSSTQTTEETTADDSTSAKKVVIVTGGEAEPYSLVHADGSWTGIDSEMWTEIQARTGWEVELLKTTFDSIFGELDAGRANLAANCFATKAERCEKYYSSIPYYGDGQAIAVNASNTDIQTFADLAGKKVGLTSGQASQTIIEKMAEEYGFEMVVYEQSNIGCQELTLGRIDAMASAVTVFNNFSANNDAELRILDERLTANNVAYFFPRTDEGKALRDELNVVLQEMLDDGTVAAITEKWLFGDMTQLIKTPDPALEGIDN